MKWRPRLYPPLAPSPISSAHRLGNAAVCHKLPAFDSRACTLRRELRERNPSLIIKRPVPSNHSTQRRSTASVVCRLVRLLIVFGVAQRPGAWPRTYMATAPSREATSGYGLRDTKLPRCLPSPPAPKRLRRKKPRDSAHGRLKQGCFLAGVQQLCKNVTRLPPAGTRSHRCSLRAYYRCQRLGAEGARSKRDWEE